MCKIKSIVFFKYFIKLTILGRERNKYGSDKFFNVFYITIINLFIFSEGHNCMQFQLSSYFLLMCEDIILLSPGYHKFCFEVNFQCYCCILFFPGNHYNSTFDLLLILYFLYLDTNCIYVRRSYFILHALYTTLRILVLFFSFSVLV